MRPWRDSGLLRRKSSSQWRWLREHHAQTKTPAFRPGLVSFALVWRLVALAEELQEQREQVDEVQVQRQRAGDGRTLCDVTAGRGVAVDVVVLQPLGIPGGEAREHQHA